MCHKKPNGYPPKNDMPNRPISPPPPPIKLDSRWMIIVEAIKILEEGVIKRNGKNNV